MSWKLVSIDSDNGFVFVMCQAITWTNDDLLSVGPVAANLNEIELNIQHS